MYHYNKPLQDFWVTSKTVTVSSCSITKLYACQWEKEKKTCSAAAPSGQSMRTAWKTEEDHTYNFRSMLILRQSLYWFSNV